MLPIVPLTVGFVAGFSVYRAYYNARLPPAAAPDAPLAADDAGHNDVRPRRERQRRCCSLISFCFLLAIPRLAATYKQMADVASTRVTCSRWNHNVDRLFIKYNQSGADLLKVFPEIEQAGKESQAALENAQKSDTIAKECLDRANKHNVSDCFPKLAAFHEANLQSAGAGTRFNATLAESEKARNLLAKTGEAYDAEKASRPWFCVWRPGETMRKFS